MKILKKMIFVFIVLWTCIASQGAEYFNTTSDPIIGYDAHIKAGKDFLSIFNGNIEKIKTWQGELDVVKKIWDSKTQKELLYHLEYTIKFHYDAVQDRKRYVAEQVLGQSNSTGKWTDFLLRKESVIVSRINPSVLPVIAYINYTMQPGKEDSGIASQVSFLQDVFSLQMYFAPLPYSSPDKSISSITSIFDVFDTKNLEQKYQKQGMDANTIKKLIGSIKENGFPDHWKLSSKDHYLYFDAQNGTHYTWDLNRGGCTTFYKSGTRVWNCDLQEVSTIWIPKKILISYIILETGEYITEEMVWKKQMLNEPIDEKLWTMASLGVRRGDFGYDERIDKAFIVTGNEYLPSLKEEEALRSISQSKHPYSRYIIITISLLLIIFALLSKFLQRKK
jgi:hypothetical protein